MLQNAASWLAAQRTKFGSQPVSYSRGQQSVTLSAAAGRSQFEMIDDSGFVTTWESRDFLFEACRLVLGGHLVEPAEDDRITDASGRVYQVMAPTGRKAWRYDRHRVSIRVFTKQVDRPA